LEDVLTDEHLNYYNYRKFEPINFMKNLNTSLDKIRNQFPSLTKMDGTNTLAYFERPGGS